MRKSNPFDGIGLRVLALSLLLAVAVFACDDDETTPGDPGTDTGPDMSPDMAEPDVAGPGTIVEVAAQAGSFTTLLAAADTAGLADVLNGPGPFTVFAPTDDAFADLLAALGVTAEELLARSDLDDILLYHTLDVEADAAVVTGQSLHRTALGSFVLVTTDASGGVFINDAAVTTANIEASNGIIHIIDTVLLPPDDIVTTVVNNEDFSILEQVVTSVGTSAIDLLSGDGPLTVFAPTDDAFEDLAAALGLSVSDLLVLPNLAEILLYHVVEAGAAAADVVSLDRVTTVNGIDLYIEVTDDGVVLNYTEAGGINVTATDVLAANGIIHILDAVLIPPTIPEVAELEGAFGSLLAALGEAELAETLADPDAEFTVFAPTDDAFDALAAALQVTVADLLALDNLADILLYHVVDGETLAEDVVTLERVSTLLGQDPEMNSSEDDYFSPVAVRVDGDDVFINEAQVVITDVFAGNGVIHVIDFVLMPQDAVEIASSNEDFESLTAAVIRAELDDDLSAPNGPLTIFAPTDDAFAALLADLGAQSIDDIDLDTLGSVLSLHVVAGDFLGATDVVGATMLDTLLGEDTLTVIVSDSAVQLSNGAATDPVVANVLQTNIAGSNAIIHVIDAVLLPAE